MAKPTSEFILPVVDVRPGSQLLEEVLVYLELIVHGVLQLFDGGLQLGCTSIHT